MNYAEWKKSVPREIQDDAIMADDTTNPSDLPKLADLLEKAPMPEL